MALGLTVPNALLISAHEVIECGAKSLLCDKNGRQKLEWSRQLMTQLRHRRPILV
jgi:ferredoxin-like protein FixX